MVGLNLQGLVRGRRLPFYQLFEHRSRHEVPLGSLELFRRIHISYRHKLDIVDLFSNIELFDGLPRQPTHSNLKEGVIIKLSRYLLFLVFVLLDIVLNIVDLSSTQVVD
jgi:hypothetical protein